MDSTLSQKILSAAREQQREIEQDLSENATPKQTPSINLSTNDSDSDSDSEEQNTLEAASFYENIEINEEDEKALELFMNKNAKPQRTLADIIMESITEKKTELETHFSDAGTLQMQEIDPRVKQMYEGVRDVLRKYRSGKLPKAFKIIPNLRNWEQILYITGKYVFKNLYMFLSSE